MLCKHYNKSSLDSLSTNLDHFESILCKYQERFLTNFSILLISEMTEFSDVRFQFVSGDFLLPESFCIGMTSY